MLEYKIKPITYGSGKVMYVPVFEDRRLDLLAHFMSDDYFLLRKEIEENLGRLDSGGFKATEFAGNSCRVSLGRNTCMLEATVDGIDVGIVCVVPTEDFRSLLRDWERDLETLKKVVV
jgi:hypothetical protein